MSLGRKPMRTLFDNSFPTPAFDTHSNSSCEWGGGGGHIPFRVQSCPAASPECHTARCNPSTAPLFGSRCSRRRKPPPGERRSCKMFAGDAEVPSWGEPPAGKNQVVSRQVESPLSPGLTVGPHLLNISHNFEHLPLIYYAFGEQTSELGFSPKTFFC